MIHGVKNSKCVAFEKYPYPRSHSVGRANTKIARYKGNMSAYQVVTKYLPTTNDLGYFKLFMESCVHIFIIQWKDISHLMILCALDSKIKT